MGRWMRGGKADVIRLHEEGLSARKIAKELKAQPCVIHRILNEFGLIPNCESVGWTYDEIRKKEIVDRYVAGESVKDLSKETGISTAAINHWCKRAGVLRNHSVTFDDSVFETITEESAYWIGFLMADGCIADKNKGNSQTTIRLGIAVSDIGHVEKFKAFLKSDGKISIIANGKGEKKCRYKTATITISSTKMANDLARFGVGPRKSLTAEVKLLENDRHFWRGAIDGDGSIYINEGKPMVEFVGSHIMVGQFMEYAKVLIPKYNANQFKKGNVSNMQLSGTCAQLMIENLYAGAAIGLNRKMDLARGFLDNPYVDQNLRTEETREYARSQYKLGRTCVDIAHELDAHASTISRWVDQADIQRHPNGWPFGKPRGRKKHFQPPTLFD